MKVVQLKACLGGTFNILHKGHEKLIETAFRFSDDVLIGLSTDEFSLERNKEVRSYAERKAQLEKLLAEKSWKAEIVPLMDEMGPAAEMQDLDLIVVSEETRKTAERINEARMAKSLDPLIIIVIPMQLEGGKKISSSLLKKSVEK